MTDDGKRRWRKPADAPTASSGRSMAPREKVRNAKTESSRRWIERQLADPYVKRAKDSGYRARAAFKLLEIDEKTGLLRRGARVVDLGCAPGGWMQVALERGAAEVAGIDLLPVEPLAGVRIVEGDVEDQAAAGRLLAGLTGPPDIVLSDMAANTTGHRRTDHLRTAALAEAAAAFAVDHLAPGGAFCAKVFQGGATPELLARLKRSFATVKHVKPPASRSGSPEIYVVAKGFRSAGTVGDENAG